MQQDYSFWFCVGSQELYGEECLRHVAEHAKTMVEGINASGVLPFPLVLRPVLINAPQIHQFFSDAARDRSCAGILAWMHTFSPAKSWIAGLQANKKPLLHFHTQFNEAIPYDTIDMDFMNENQSAHGGREFGHMVSRLGIARKVVAGHWQNPEVLGRIAAWMHTAVGIVESGSLRVMRVADNMRNVAVTEGDKVEAQIRFGWEVDAWPVNDLVQAVDAVSTADADLQVEEYYDSYDLILDGRDPEEFRRHVAVQARMEVGFERFLREKGYQAIVTHFDDLGAFEQLPGLVIQRLMQKGYGFGAEGDWKTAAMVRLMKRMSQGMKDAKGCSMLEDYTYSLVPGAEGILQAHMLEICPSLASGKPAIRCLPLGIGGKADPARLVFTSKTGPGTAVSLIDLGKRFRLIIAEVDCKAVARAMPRLPVATAFWTPEPDFTTGVEAWILAGGAHHTAFSFDLSVEQMADWAEHMGIEALVIDRQTTLRQFKKDIMLGQAFYR